MTVLLKHIKLFFGMRRLLIPCQTSFNINVGRRVNFSFPARLRFILLLAGGLIFHSIAIAQVDLSQYVINSWGGEYSSGAMSMSSSAGEAVILTVNKSDSSLFLTQGFQQPNMYTFLGLNATAVTFNASCLGNTDGQATASATGGVGQYTYSWSNGKLTANNDSLSAGTYTVMVSDSIGKSQTLIVSVGENNYPCNEIKIFHGITPNGDNYNDTWKIIGISQFPDNDMTVFNRWGDKVWEGKHYDNIDVVWKGQNMHGGLLPDGTYFYIFHYDNKTIKGWVELTR